MPTMSAHTSFDKKINLTRSQMRRTGANGKRKCKRYLWVCIHICMCESGTCHLTNKNWFFRRSLTVWQYLSPTWVHCAIVYGHDVVQFLLPKQLGNRNKFILLASHAGSSKRTTTTTEPSPIQLPSTWHLG